VYELTDSGAELAWALLPIVHWGARHALLSKARAADEIFHVEWALLAMAASIDPAHTPGVGAEWEFRVDDSVGHVSVHDGRMTVGAGPSPVAPDVVLTADTEAFVAAGTGMADIAKLMSAKRLRIDGTKAAVAEFLRIVTSWRADEPSPIVKGRTFHERTSTR
jgi:hypothetical protein